MATVTGTNPYAGLSGATSASANAPAGAGEIAGNFQQFLLLLTTQLKNQSPLDPLDTNQFTQQLVQFASVEQQLKTNTALSTLVAGAKASTASAAAGLVGSTVTADGTSASFAGGAATWSLDPARAAASATLTIKDATGTTVATQTRALPAGGQTFTWDGRTANGNVASAGTYTLAVAARDAAGQAVPVKTDVTGIVNAVDMTGENPVLVIGANRVALSGVKSIGQ